jgi:hypothetical protein
MTVAAQATGNHIGEIGFVFNYEEAHDAPR